MKQVTFGQLRSCKLPPQRDDEPDLIASLRKNCDSEHPDGLLVTVPDEMAAMIPVPVETKGSTTKQEQPPKS